MKRFIEGKSRFQSTLFPETLEDFITEDNPVRVIEAFVEELDLNKLEFKSVNPSATGRPAYHPSVLLKIYIYVYLNRVLSTRRLEREAHRNIELMWLTDRLTPDFKTIADFRKNNGKAIQNVCREFVLLCRHLNLFAKAIVAIDGSKFKAVNNRDKNFTQAKMKRRIEEVEKSIERYLGKMDSVDQEEPDVTELKTTRINEKLESLQKEMERLRLLEAQLLDEPDKQISLTDPDSRSMKTRGIGIVGYNVQTAVDTEHHLIVAHEVTNVGNDRNLLYTMSKQASSATGNEKLTIIADRGYYKYEQILDCHKAGFITYIPKSQTSGNQAKGLFGKKEFKYIPLEDVYSCPAGEKLIYRMTTEERGHGIHRYWSSNCGSCSIKSQCTTSKERRVSRREREDVLDEMQARLDREPDKMLTRKSTVEHPFGTLKNWMGWTHFQTKTLKHVSTEMSLHVLSYNLKRVMNILGIKPLIQAIQA